MWDMFLAHLAEWAPYARYTAFGLIIFAFVAMQIAKLRVRALNGILGWGLVGASLTFSASIVVLYLQGLAQTITAGYDANGVLILYGVIWPVLMILFGLSIAYIGSASEERSKVSKDA